MTEPPAAGVQNGRSHRMAVDTVSSTPKRVLLVAANPTVSSNNGWPVGLWAAELTHPWYELTERGVQVTIASPDGGRIEFDALSDPRDESRWSAEDLVSMGFIHTPELMALLEDTPRLADLHPADFDALLICGGQSPMFTFPDNVDLQETVRAFYEAEKITGPRARRGRDPVAEGLDPAGAAARVTAPLTVAVLGAGTVGRTLAAGWSAAGHRVVLGSREPDGARMRRLSAELGAEAATHAGAARRADIAVVTVPGNEVDALVARLDGALAGRTRRRRDERPRTGAGAAPRRRAGGGRCDGVPRVQLRRVGADGAAPVRRDRR